MKLITMNKIAILLLFLISKVHSTCTNFNVTGLLDLFEERKSTGLFCAVTCNVKKGFYFADIIGKQKRTIRYYTIAKYDGKEWVLPPPGTPLAINCQPGCDNKFVEMAPSYMISKDILIINDFPMKIFLSSTTCLSGHFSKFKDEDTEFFKYCTRKIDDKMDSYSWAHNSHNKFKCTAGCHRFGTYSIDKTNSYYSAFGVDLLCKHIGKIYGESRLNHNLVSSCNGVCNTKLGYFPIFDNDLNIRCSGDGKWHSEPNFMCEQGCRISDRFKISYEAEFGVVLKSFNKISGDFYSSAIFTCKEDHVRVNSGVFGISDILHCRLGRFDNELSRMKCAPSCSKIVDNCQRPARCIGVNDEGKYYCVDESKSV